MIEEASDPGSKARMLCVLSEAVTDPAQKRSLLADALMQAVRLAKPLVLRDGAGGSWASSCSTWVNR